MANTRIGKCLACHTLVEWTNWAAGPVCYPCYWGAKLLYENGISRVEDIQPLLGEQLRQIFQKGGYQWPDDLIKAWKRRAFESCNTELLRWWSPKEKHGTQEESNLP